MDFKVPSTIILTGSSGCGKSTLIERMLCNEGVFSEPISEIRWVYAKHTFDEHRFKRLSNCAVAPIDFVEGYPDELIASNKLFTVSKSAHKVLVIEDILTHMKRIDSLFQLFTVLSHHQNITVLVSTQSLGGFTASQKNCLNVLLRNTGYLILFPGRRTISTAKTIALQYFCGESYKLLDVVREVLKAPKHRYIVIDLLTDKEELTIREGGIAEQAYGFKHDTIRDKR